MTSGLSHASRLPLVILLTSYYACICDAKGIVNSINQPVLSYSVNIVKKENANPVQFFNLGLVNSDININKVKLSISPNISYSFATVRLSAFPVEKYGDQESSGWFFTGNPPANMGTFGSWWPGSGLLRSIAETGSYPLKKGTYLVLEVSFNKSSRPNGGSVDFKLYQDEPIKPHVNRTRYFNRFEKTDIMLPPLTESLELSEVYTLTENIQLHTLKPTLHLRGVHVTMGYIRSADEGPQILVNIPNYSFFSYRGYKLKKPLSLKKGNKLWIKGVYNNSFSNLFNPNPLTTVYRGWKIHDEMLRFSYQYYKE